MTPTSPSTTLPTFGSFVWWNFRKIAVTPHELRSVVASHGFTATVPSINANVEVRALARGWKEGRGNASRFKSEIAHEDDFTITVGILCREQVGVKEIGWVQVDRLVWDKSAHSWLSSGISGEAAAFRAEALRVVTLLDHNAVRPIVQTVLDDLRSFRLRDQGGFYFVPYTSNEAEIVERLRALVSDLGTSTLLVAEQNSGSARTSVGEEARESLSARLGEMREQIAEWRAKARNARKDAVGNLLEEFTALRERADLYADALRIRLDDLVSEIESVREDARRLVRDEDEKRPAEGLVGSLVTLLDGYDLNEDGIFVLALDDLSGTALPEAARTSPARYWTSNTAGRRAFSAMGLDAVLDPSGTRLLLRPVASDEQRDEDESGPVEEIESVA